MYNAITECAEKTQMQRYQGEGHAVRNNYYRSLSMLVNSFEKIYNDLKHDELEERLDKLEERFKDD